LAPKGASFNEAIDPYSLHKLTMTSPLLFSQALLQFGNDARFGKMDIENAYKLIPVHPDDWHHWVQMGGGGGMHFFEQATAFGNSAAPAQFNSVAETVVTIAQTLSNTPPQCIFRQLDDTYHLYLFKKFIHHREFCFQFSSACKDIHIPLVPECPQKEKAFLPSTQGTVLGIRFDSSNHLGTT
jgi:hypothetical protein